LLLYVPCPLKDATEQAQESEWKREEKRREERSEARRRGGGDVRREDK
jgi:hypothetical protein